MGTRITRIDPKQYGPWALVTGASSGIGREFARQLAANGINVVLAARRRRLLDELGLELTEGYGVGYRVVPVDLTEPDFLATLAAATDDVDLGLVVSNAGDMVLGEFLDADMDTLLREMRVNAEAHLRVSHHFGRRMARRGRGGIILVSSVAGIQGVPNIANYSATKAYALTLGEAVHHELARSGVHVTVLVPGATRTDMIARFGADQTPMGRMAMPVDACVRGALAAMRANRATHVSGRMNRAVLAVVPRSARIRMFGAMNAAMARRVGAPSASPANN